MSASSNRESPCKTCARVRDPENCENKICREWRSWWTQRWDAMRSKVLAQVNGPGIQAAQVSVGGIAYHHPEHMREYLSKEPCKRCLWAADLCPGSCTVKEVWTAARERMDELEE